MSTNLNDIVNSFQSDVELVHQFVKGDKTVIVNASDGSYPSLAKIAADNQNFLTNIINSAQSNISATLDNVNGLVSTSQATVDKAVSDAQLATSTMVNDYKEAIDANQAALEISQEALAAVLHSAQGMIAKTFTFTNVLDLVINHNTGTINFSYTIISNTGDVVYAPFIINDNNKFTVKFTDYETGIITVIFYLF
jgi:ABC-type transporter Mla subunit MlaD